MLKLLMFILILSVLRECYAHEADKPCTCDNVLDSYIYDDASIRKLVQFVELLDGKVRILQDLLTLRLDKQSEIANELSRNLSTYLKGNIEKDCEVVGLKEKESSNISNNTCAPLHRLPANCAEAACGSRKSGIYKIQVDSLMHRPFLAACDEETQDGGWTVIQRRLDGSIDFYRNWNDYKKGFGNLDGEFFIGLDRLHALTTDTPQELLIVMEDFDHSKKFAKYDAFAIGDEAEAYALKLLGKFTGDGGDSFRIHASNKWTTKDVDHDGDPDNNCAVVYTGAWWYKSCHESNLNGQYLRGDYPHEQYAKGIVWETFRGYNYALKYVQMMIRPQRK